MAKRWRVVNVKPDGFGARRSVFNERWQLPEGQFDHIIRLNGVRTSIVEILLDTPTLFVRRYIDGSSKDLLQIFFLEEK